MSNQRKQNISVRMSASDLRRIREIAARLKVRESDVFRFAVRSSLAKLTPLQDTHTAGRDLVPVFIEFGSELTSYFELDQEQLESIINGPLVDQDKRVARDDIELLASWGMQDHYVHMRLREAVSRERDGATPGALLRQYLYEKYVSGNKGERRGADAGQVLDGAASAAAGLVAPSAV